MTIITASNTSGTIHYGRSFITLLQQKLDTFIQFDGLIDTKVAGQRQRLSEIGKKMENMEDRIAKLYQRYNTQYAAMESTIAGLEETGNLLENAFKRQD